MKLASLLTGIAMVGLVTVGDVSLKGFAPSWGGSAAVAQTKQQSEAQKNIDLISKNKGQIGSGDQLRRFFFGELEPIGIQPGGGGHVVNLYNKTNDVTFAYCSHFDVVVAVKKGKVTAFLASEVK